MDLTIDAVLAFGCLMMGISIYCAWREIDALKKRVKWLEELER